MKNSQRMIAMIVGMCLLVGCVSSEEPIARSNEPATTESEKQIKDIVVPCTDRVLQGKEENSDTIGWLSVPGTYVNDVVLQGDTNYDYYRMSCQKEYDFYGSYYADYRVDLREGNEELPLNTVIYGQSITDNMKSENYSVRFSSLHNFRDETYVREHPYIFYSTEKEDYVFEVFAVFVASADNADIPYNDPTLSPEDFIDMVETEVLPRSIWNYEDVSVSETDKFLTLSTSIYQLENGRETGLYTWYRMGIMARLVSSEDQVKDSVNIIYNKKAIVDEEQILRW